MLFFKKMAAGIRSQGQQVKNHFTLFLGVFTHTPPEGGEKFTLLHRHSQVDSKWTGQE